MDREKVGRDKMIWVASLAALFTLVFCVGFAFFYTRRQQDLAPQFQVGIGHPLPVANLIRFFQSTTDRFGTQNWKGYSRISYS